MATFKTYTTRHHTIAFTHIALMSPLMAQVKCNEVVTRLLANACPEAEAWLTLRCNLRVVFIARFEGIGKGARAKTMRTPWS